jgi:hypothetical protein
MRFSRHTPKLCNCYQFYGSLFMYIIFIFSADVLRIWVQPPRAAGPLQILHCPEEISKKLGKVMSVRKDSVSRYSTTNRVFFCFLPKLHIQDDERVVILY